MCATQPEKYFAFEKHEKLLLAVDVDRRFELVVRFSRQHGSGNVTLKRPKNNSP
jgi:hypothetical protein